MPGYDVTPPVIRYFAKRDVDRVPLYDEMPEGNFQNGT